MIAKPFIKWVGGKGKLVPELEKYFPKKITRYFEPFIGGGAVFYEVIKSNNLEFSLVNDINKKLITTYQQIKTRPNELISNLEKLEKEYKKKTEEEREIFFYLIRDKYNKEKLEDSDISAYLIFLNKTCFNGMYRENSKGEYNVPFGDQRNPTICDKENLLVVSECLKNTKITNLSFEESIEDCKKGDFIYFDPPYYPINGTSKFTSYSKDNFGQNEQIRLRDVFKKLSDKGCLVMLSNSNTEFIKDLYKDFKINFIDAARSINSKGKKRGKIKEIVVTNYII
jgi:DNA adenine methylase